MTPTMKIVATLFSLLLVYSIFYCAHKANKAPNVFSHHFWITYAVLSAILAYLLHVIN